jgi:hypothetical protein
MTPSSLPEFPTVAAPRDGGVTPPGGGLGVIADRFAGVVERAEFRAAIAGVVYFTARCSRCGDGGSDPLVEPFRDEAERDEWAAGHVTGTGHVVVLTIDGLEGLPMLHMVGVLSRDQNSQFRFVCPADDCGTSCGPYDRAATAIASWRTHRPSAKSRAAAR